MTASVADQETSAGRQDRRSRPAVRIARAVHGALADGYHHLAANWISGASTTMATETPEKPTSPAQPRKSGRGPIWLIVLALALVLGGFLAYPRIELALSTVSTDDAYVNAHVTFLAPRIAESVVEVRFDNNDFVKKGDLVIVLDDAVEKIRVAQAKASLKLARDQVAAELATTRAIVAQAKANRYKLASAQTDVRNQVASLRAAIADLRQREAAEKLAKLEADRYANLARNNSVTREQADVRETDFAQAQQATLAAREQIRKIRSGLEVPEEPPAGKPLDDLPPNLDQIHSSVLAALGTFAYSLAEVGMALPGFYQSPDDFIKQVKAQAPDGDLDSLVEQTVVKAPAVESSRAKVAQAQQELAQAELNLSYCKIVAEIDGFISNRNVNPGDRVAQGQRLMAIRSSEEVWVDCNFKETEIEPIRIGHPVDLRVDAYPGRVFKARVTGFNPGTGSSLALLPAQNATGNFVKIVQRLPVRVELVGPNPKDTPLYVGLSCVPYIKIREQPEGPNAGQRLRGAFPKVDGNGQKSK